MWKKCRKLVNVSNRFEIYTKFIVELHQKFLDLSSMDKNAFMLGSCILSNIFCNTCLLSLSASRVLTCSAYSIQTQLAQPDIQHVVGSSGNFGGCFEHTLLQHVLWWRPTTKPLRQIKYISSSSGKQKKNKTFLITKQTNGNGEHTWKGQILAKRVYRQ